MIADSSPKAWSPLTLEDVDVFENKKVIELVREAERARWAT